MLTAPYRARPSADVEVGMKLQALYAVTVTLYLLYLLLYGRDGMV